MSRMVQDRPTAEKKPGLSGTGYVRAPQMTKMVCNDGRRLNQCAGRYSQMIAVRPRTPNELLVLYPASQLGLNISMYDLKMDADTH